MPKSSQVAPFVKKTYEMISDTSYREVISWSDEGSSFIIWKPQKFRKKVIPLYFKHNNLCSFIRQLNTYGFHKVNRLKKEDFNQPANEQANEILEFKHHHFIRDRKDLLCEITRKKSKQKVETKESDIPEKSMVKASPVSPTEPLCRNDVVESIKNNILNNRTVFDRANSNFSFANMSSQNPFSCSSTPSSCSPSPPSTPSPEMTPIHVSSYSLIPTFSQDCNMSFNPSYHYFDHNEEKYKLTEERNKLSKTVSFLNHQVQQLSEELKNSQEKIKELENELLMVHQFSPTEFNTIKRRRISPTFENFAFNYHNEFQLNNYFPIQDQFAGLSNY